MAAVPAGWYPDPEEPTRVRWFDGSRWTDRVRTVTTVDDAAPAPVPSQRPASMIQTPTTILPSHGARRRFARH